MGAEDCAARRCRGRRAVTGQRSWARRTILIGSFACPVIEPRGRQAAVQHVGARAVVGTRNQAVVGPEVQAKSCQVEDWRLT